jgi:ABC-2 type transport system ATP-binding protein
VRENLRAAALLHGLERARIDAEVAMAIDEFELGHWADRRSRALSLGNKQRLGLASALVHHPSIVVLDEPANALDPAGVVFIRDLMRTSAEQGTAVLVSSHHLDQLARVAHRISLLHRGRIIGTLDPSGHDLEEEFFDQVYRYDRERGAA